MSDRREFLRTAALAGIGMSIMPSLRAFADDKPTIGWNDIPSLFIKEKDYHYFNTGTMGLSPKHVINAYKDAIDQANSKGIYSQHEAPLKSALAKFINCSENEIALTHNVTEGINIAAWSLPLNEGDEVILCTHEHAGNALPWLNRAKVDKLSIRLIELGANGNETLVNIAKIISSKTKVIALPHVPCTIGHVLPIKEICDLAKKFNCYSCIDGAHGAGMLELDMKDIGCDFYSSCFHKWMLGPKGSGFLYINEKLLPRLNTYYVGAHSDLGWSFEGGKVDYKGLKPDSAHRYYYGTQSDSIYAASKASIDFINTLGAKKVVKKISELGHYLCKRLEEIEGIKLLVSTKKSETAGIISFKTLKKDFMEVNQLLSNDNFRLRIVTENGLDCIRVSTHIYCSKTEIDEFAVKLAAALK